MKFQMTSCLAGDRKSCAGFSMFVCLSRADSHSHRLQQRCQQDGTVPPVCVSALPIGGGSNMSHRSHTLSYVVTWLHIQDNDVSKVVTLLQGAKLCQLSHLSNVSLGAGHPAWPVQLN